MGEAFLRPFLDVVARRETDRLHAIGRRGTAASWKSTPSAERNASWAPAGRARIPISHGRPTGECSRVLRPGERLGILRDLSPRHRDRGEEEPITPEGQHWGDKGPVLSGRPVDSLHAKHKHQHVGRLPRSLEGGEPERLTSDGVRCGVPRSRQSLAADAAANAYVLTDLEPALASYGARGYRIAALEGGLLGGRPYLAAYAWKLGATGLTFYDDAVTEFFSPHARGKSVMFLVAMGVRGKRPRL